MGAFLPPSILLCFPISPLRCCALSLAGSQPPTVLRSCSHWMLLWEALLTAPTPAACSREKPEPGSGKAPDALASSERSSPSGWLLTRPTASILGRLAPSWRAAVREQGGPGTTLSAIGAGGDGMRAPTHTGWGGKSKPAIGIHWHWSWIRGIACTSGSSTNIANLSCIYYIFQMLTPYSSEAHLNILFYCINFCILPSMSSNWNKKNI